MSLSSPTKSACLVTFALTLGALLAPNASAQRRPPARPTPESGKDTTKVTDPELMTLHKEFVSKAERLAAEYERKRELPAAKQVYEAMTRLVPDYEPALIGLKRVLAAQSTQDRKVVEVHANRDWQDTKIDIVEGNPVRISVQGDWVVVVPCGPDGVEIPKEMDPKNSKIKLGSLVGVVFSGDPKKLKPFPIGDGTEFIAQQSGRLGLKMFDIDPSDNRGTVTVMIQGTFESGK